jgi:hypothetical protein
MALDIMPLQGNRLPPTLGTGDGHLPLMPCTFDEKRPQTVQTATGGSFSVMLELQAACKQTSGPTICPCAKMAVEVEMAKGFVYILSNPSLPGLLKIGFSRKVPDERADELYTTGVPSPFVVEFYCLTEGDMELESTVHRLLSSARHSANREFFRIDLREAVACVRGACKPEHVWTREQIAKPKIRPPAVECTGCGASYVVATHCPKCKLKLEW